MNQEEIEEFNRSMTNVNEVMDILKSMNCGDKSLEKQALDRADHFLGGDKIGLNEINEDDFLIKVNQNRTIINKPTASTSEPGTQDPVEFMKTMEKDANDRAADRKSRESIAQGLRKRGNEAYRNEEYERAINLYTKAIDQVKDSPILYNNRALCYIQLKLYKRAIIDCDFVINKLEEKNLRSWLYRAKGYFLMGEKRNFEKSIAEARKHNPSDSKYIDKIVADMKGSKLETVTMGDNLQIIEN